MSRPKNKGSLYSNHSSSTYEFSSSKSNQCSIIFSGNWKAHIPTFAGRREQMDQQQQQQHQQNGQAQGIQGQKARQQAQQEPPQRQPRPERPERLFVTTMSNITYKYMPIIFGILFITAGTLVLTYTFMDHPLPRKVAWGMIGSFGGVCVFFLLGMICLFLDKNCEEKKAWNKRASRASIAFDIEHGLDSPSCPHRCANRVEGAWGWMKECFYQRLCFGLCFPCASKKRGKSRRQGNREPEQELDDFIQGGEPKT